MNDPMIRVGRVLANAYKNCSSQSYIDEEAEYLERAGVLLPNGFTPMPPLFSEEGGEMLLAFDM